MKLPAPERSFMIQTLSVRHLAPAMTEEEAFGLTNRPTLLIPTDVDHIVCSSELGLRPDGTPLYVFIKNFIPYPLCVSAYPVALAVAGNPVIGGTRAIAAGSFMAPRTRTDGTKGKRYEVAFQPHLEGAKNGIAGYYSDRHLQGKLDCRLTAFAAERSDEFEELLPLTRKAAEAFREYLPERYGVQAEAASRIDKRFVIEFTPFTTITINRNWQTAAHLDEGDLQSGFGVLTLLTAGEFSGGELAFPKYRIALDLKMQDVLLCDVHEVHGNLPIVGTQGDYERVSLVFYLRENMLEVCPSDPRP
jgi:hypothetical protein